jgi:hypothetical protein
LYLSDSDDVASTVAPLTNSRKRNWQERGLVSNSDSVGLQDSDANIDPHTPGMELVDCRPTLSSTQVKQQAKYLAGGSLASRSSTVKRAATMGDDLAKTVINIVAHYEKAATHSSSLVDDVVLLVGGSGSELRLNHVLQLFYDGKADNHQDAMFSEELMSVLLTHERPGADSYALATCESLAAWLSCDSDLDNRVSSISADIVAVINGKVPQCNSYPFQNVGLPGTTRHFLFCYKPSKSWVTVETSYDDCYDSVKSGKINLIGTSHPDSTYDMAKKELVPLLTLARISPTSPFSGIQWDEGRVSMTCQFQSTSRLHSGPLSILTAVYKLNGEPLPINLQSSLVGLVWRIRHACARRVLYLLEGTRGRDGSQIFLHDLLKQHTKGTIPAKLPNLRNPARSLNATSPKQATIQTGEAIVTEIDSDENHVSQSTHEDYNVNETASEFTELSSKAVQLPNTDRGQRPKRLNTIRPGPKMKPDAYKQCAKPIA